MGDSRSGLDDPRTVRKLLRIFYVICAGLFLLDFVVTRHVEHDLESWPGFYAVFGFVGCVVLVFAAKWMRVFLMRAENYYDDEFEDQLDDPLDNQPSLQENESVDR